MQIQERMEYVICPLYVNVGENEIHFVLLCPFLGSLRTKFTDCKYFRKTNNFRFMFLLLINNEENFVFFIVDLRTDKNQYPK